MQKSRRMALGFGIACLLAAGMPARANDAAAGSAAAWEQVGAFPRALSLGGAVTAVSGDGAAVFWNPAGLADLPRQDIQAAYAVFAGAGDFSQLAYVLPLNTFQPAPDGRAGSPGAARAGGIGIFAARLATAYDIEARRIDSLNPDYLFSATEGGYGVAAGLPWGDFVQIGLVVKGLYQRLDQVQGDGWGVDAGIQWEAMPGLNVGLAAKNIYARVDWPGQYHDLVLPAFRLGAAYGWTSGNWQEILFCLEAEKRLSWEEVRFRAGLEIGLGNLIFFRGGSRDGRLTAGAGFRIPGLGWARAGLQLDYALVEDGIEGWDHWMGLKLEL